MPDGKTPSALAIVRLEKANQCLHAAEKNFAMDLYMTSVNRSYYCIFHSMRAVLALDKFDSWNILLLSLSSGKIISKPEYFR